MAPTGCANSMRTLLSQQDWALWILVVVCIAGIGVMEFMDPVQRPVFIYDATIAYENKPNTIDDFLAPLIPAIVFIGSLVLVECYLFRKTKTATAAAVLRFFFSCFAALTVVGFLTELFKLICGRLRPDFLDRCKPAIAPGDVMRTFDLMAAEKEWGHAIGVTCTGKDPRFLRDGRVSFPSGHSSTSYVVGWFGCFYLIWGTCIRAGHQMNKRLYRPHDSALRRLGKEAISSLLLVLMLFQLAYPWGVGVSRFRDNRHNASDIIAGMMLGLTFAPAFLLRAVGQHDYWMNHYGVDETEGLMSGDASTKVVPAPNGNSPAQPSAAAAGGSELPLQNL